MSAQYFPHSAACNRTTNQATNHHTMAKVILALLLSLFIISNSLANRTYGPVKATDFLSKIVNKSYPSSSLTKNQIMVAILRSNPEAFRGGNIHFLKQAVILNLPNENDIASISKDEASALIAEHLALFKRGKTGNFVHKALVTSQTKDSSLAVEPNPAEGSTQAKTQEPSESGSSESQVPTKVKIEIRKQKQVQDNKLKHVKSLEKISTQQNKTLSTLDEQIRVLEDQLKEDNDRKNKAIAAAAEEEAANEEPVVEETKSEDENTTAENAISSLESVLSVPTPEVIEEPTAKTQETNTNIETKPEVEVERTTSETSILQPEIKKIEPETATDETTVNETPVHETPIDNTNNKASTVTVTESPNEEPATSQENTIAPASKPTLSRIEEPKVIGILTVAIIGLLALAYFLLGRKTQQQPIATTVPFEKSSYNESADKLSKTSLPENILNPVIKAQGSKSTDADSNLKASTKTSEEDSEIKINMARAYMDMGYIDAARESLEEVQKEGTAEQKDTVEQMLSML